MSLFTFPYVYIYISIYIYLYMKKTIAVTVKEICSQNHLAIIPCHVLGTLRYPATSCAARMERQPHLPSGATATISNGTFEAPAPASSVSRGQAADKTTLHTSEYRRSRLLKCKCSSQQRLATLLSLAWR